MVLRWCRQRRPWLTFLLTGCAVLSLVFPPHRPPAVTTNSEPVPFCRPDMEVNRLPPMSADNKTMISDLFTYLTKPNDNTCRKVLKFGGMAMQKGNEVPRVDGHKFVCMDPEFSLLATDNCLVYSFGISDDWSFDWDMESFGCTVLAFDPTTNDTTGYQNGTIVFYKFGIGREDGVVDNMELRTLDTFTTRLGHANRTIQYLKMDVEYSEWGVFQQQADRDHRESTLYRNVEQLGVELHFTTKQPVEYFVDFYRQAYRSFLRLQEMGFYPFSQEPNLLQEPDMTVPGFDEKIASAMEVVWLKSRCVDPTPPRQQLATG